MKAKQVRLFPAESYSTLEGNVNRFLTENKNIEIYDIKFECVVAKPQVYVYSWYYQQASEPSKKQKLIITPRPGTYL